MMMRMNGGYDGCVLAEMRNADNAWIKCGNAEMMAMDICQYGGMRIDWSAGCPGIMRNADGRCGDWMDEWGLADIAIKYARWSDCDYCCLGVAEGCCDGIGGMGMEEKLDAGFDAIWNKMRKLAGPDGKMKNMILKCGG